MRRIRTKLGEGTCEGTSNVLERGNDTNYGKEYKRGVGNFLG